MAEQDTDKTEQATPFKLEEARKHGQVAKSIEMNSFLVIVTFLAALTLWGGDIALHHAQVDRVVFEDAGKLNFDITSLSTWFGKIMMATLSMLAPFVITLMAIVILFSLIQTGPVFTFFPLKPDMKRLNPVEGFKRVFSKKLLFEAFKSLVKIGLFSTIVYLVIKGFVPRLLGMPDSDPRTYPVQLLNFVKELIFKLGMAMVIVALLDLIYTRWEFAQKMRMSPREVKEEYKRREGDPRIKSKLRELQREAAKRGQSLSRVPDADVLITNPTHLALGVVYVRGEMAAPVINAKGAGEMAQKMKAVARRNNVPIVEDKKLARALYRKTNLDQPIGTRFYPEVAKILAGVYSHKNRSNEEQTRV